jgi:prophage maintenance system killer protein
VSTCVSANERDNMARFEIMACVAMELFLIEHGLMLTADDGDAVVTFLGLAAGDVSEERMAAWIRGNVESATG